MGRSIWNEEKTKIKSQKSNRRRENYKKASLFPAKIKKVLQKAKTQALSKKDLLAVLFNQRNFLGVYSCDQLLGLRVVNQPVFLVVNLDYSFQLGSHWIVLHVTNSKVEICDSYGFSVSNWFSYPSPLIKFLNRYTSTHAFRASPRLQSLNSYTCGLFCIYFIIYRNILPFQNCFTKFSKNFSANNHTLYSALNKIKR